MCKSIAYIILPNLTFLKFYYYPKLSKTKCQNTYNQLVMNFKQSKSFPKAQTMHPFNSPEKFNQHT